ncbi:hypothetical protein [Natrinema versiforme]|uniref:Uncharacterized protein n=1 Tax=Natrinema versiforme JCM 10478 TaxID=1227496 RepID=L9Y7C3_9EURY|nr:hypothetical protein [Natrinema versiforme]ELY68838.1 hypothetical protein C489_05713 [Natrinema versiforme JCM 10478]
MTRAFIPLPESAAITDIPEGGTLRSNSDDLHAPETLRVTNTGVAFGPVHLGFPAGGLLNLERMTFLPGEGEDNSDGLLAVTAAGGAGVASTRGEDTDTSHTRRGLLTFLGALLAAAAVADPASAQDEDELVTLNIAEFEIAEPIDTPVSVAVLDTVDAVLPTTAEILIDQSEARVGEIADGGESVVLNQEPGTVSIYVRDTRGRIAQLLAWAKSFLPEDTSLTYMRELEQPASEYETDSFVRLSSHPAIVEPVRESNGDRTVLTIGNTEIPHGDGDTDSEAGVWNLLDDALVYEAGENPPAATEWTIETRLSAWQAFRA